MVKLTGRLSNCRFDANLFLVIDGRIDQAGLTSGVLPPEFKSFSSSLGLPKAGETGDFRRLPKSDVKNSC